MPTVSVSLNEIGYEGYTSIIKGNRSRIINEMLMAYALKRAKVYLNEEYMSVQQVMERQHHFTNTMKQRQDEIDILKAELKELKE